MSRDITLSGFKPDEDIEIKYIGLRPGEKLFEELITEGEGIRETEHEEIMVLYGDNHFSMEKMNNHIKRLISSADYPSTICRPRPGPFTGSYGAGVD